MPACDFRFTSYDDCMCRDCRECIAMKQIKTGIKKMSDDVKDIKNDIKDIKKMLYVNPDYFTEGEPDEFLIMRDEDK